MDIKDNFERAVRELARSLDPRQKELMIEVLMNTDGENPQVELSIEEQVRKAVQELGVPVHLKGYPYLVDAIKYVYENPQTIHGMVTKELYPSVAKLYGTTPSRVERAIRHAIECGWDRCGLDVQDEYFGSSVSPHKGRPENTLFIATVVERLRYNRN